MGSREFDIVLQGATGFTGRLAAAELQRHAPEGLRWAVAGRSRDKVEALAAELQVGAVLADGLDPDAVSRLAAATRVVLSCAGPYSRFGTPLVEACVAQRTHYADLTGETPWVRELVARHHARAQADGTSLIPASGFDSVPTDLAVQDLSERAPQAEVFHGFFQLRGGLNGGTLATALELGEKSSASSAPPAPSAPRGKSVFPVPSLNRWASPFVLAEMNEATVRRTAELTGRSLRYTEHALHRGSLAARSSAAGLAIMGGMLRSRFGRAILRRLGPKPGEGPSESARRDGFVKFVAIAGELDQPLATTTWKWPGDPANTVTTRCLVQVGLGLAAGEATMSGVVTPAAALGTQLLDRLRAIDALSID